MNEEHQIPIWFFIGVVLTFYGIVILAAGLYQLFYPPARPVALQHLHPDIWWPVVLLALGLVYIIRHAPRRSKPETGANGA